MNIPDVAAPRVGGVQPNVIPPKPLVAPVVAVLKPNAGADVAALKPPKGAAAVVVLNPPNAGADVAVVLKPKVVVDVAAGAPNAIQINADYQID